MPNLDSEIFEVIRSKGHVDYIVVPQRIADSKWVLEESVGDWFVLSVRSRYDSPYQVWGRRRTKPELLKLAQRGVIDYRKITK